MKKAGSLVFYIGNSVLKGAIIYHEKDKAPTIISSRVRELSRFNERDRQHLENKILQQFKDLVHDIKIKDFSVLNNKNVKIKNICIVLSSPWYLSETTSIKIEEQKPFTVTESMIKNSCENIVKSYKNSGGVDIDVLEQKIIRVMLNGYTTYSPLKKTAKTLEMSVFTSFVRKTSIDQIRDIVEKQFHFTGSIDIHSQSIASFSIINNIWKSSSDHYIMADITSELTEVVIVRNGVISESSSFPKGKRFLEKYISESLKVTSEVAESIIKMYSKSELDEKLHQKVSTCMEQAKTIWLKDFSQALSSMSSSASLPSKFYIFSSVFVGKTFADFILSEEYQQFSFAEGNFDVHNVSINDFKKYFYIQKEIQPDLSLVIGTILNNQCLQDNL
jgi:hypothetical protein